MAMGEFRRTHSKVWWSHYPEEDEENGVAPSPHWGPGLSLSGGERRFSSSPSNGSHKSQDSGFSDSESSSPSGSTRSTSGTKIKSPLKEEDELKDEPAESEESEGSEDTPEPNFVDPLLLHIPLSRIPRVCLAHKAEPDPDTSPNIAPNDNIILDVQEVSPEELARRYKTEPQSYQQHSVSLEIPRPQCQLPPLRFNSIECLLNEQNLFAVAKFSRSCSNLSEKDSDSSRPPSPKPVRKSTCFIVEEIPKKSFLQLQAAAIDSSSEKNAIEKHCSETNPSVKNSSEQNSIEKGSSENNCSQTKAGEKLSCGKSSSEKISFEKSSSDKLSREKDCKENIPSEKSCERSSFKKNCSQTTCSEQNSQDTTSKGNESGEKISGEKSSLEKNFNQTNSSENNSRDKPSSDKESREKLSSKRSFFEKNFSQTNSSEKNSRDKPSSEKLSSKKSFFEKNFSQRYSSEKNSKDKPISGKESGDKLSGGKSSSKKGFLGRTVSSAISCETKTEDNFRGSSSGKHNSSDKPKCDQTPHSNKYSSVIQISSDKSSYVSDKVTEVGLERIPEESPTSVEASNETTVRFLGNIDLAKAEDRVDDRNVASGTTKDKTSKSNLSWSPIKSEPEDLEESPNKTVVFGCAPTVNELPGAPAHTSTPKGTQSRVRQSQRRLLGRKGLFQQEAQRSWDSSVAQWLFELGTRYEAECMTTLQHKCLTSNSGQKVSFMTAASSQFVRDLQQRTKCIANEFSKLYRHVESESKEQLGPLVQSLVGHLNEFMQYIRTTLTEPVFNFSSREANELSKISKACEHLKATTNEVPLNFSSFSSDLSYVGKLFSQFVDSLLKCQIKSLIQILEEPASDVTLLSALSGLTGMGLEATHLASLVARCNGVRAILAICLDSRWTTVRVAALRTLATVCCSAQSIRQLEKARGVEVLADLLSDESKSEAELSEAASVLAQISAPWIEDNHKVEGLQDFINIFVTSLTRLVQKTKSSETLLLASAALANLSFMEPKAVYALLEMGSAGYLLAAVRKLGPRASVFLQEQAATMVANMAAIAETREHLAKHRAVVALLCFLQVRPSPLQRASEIAAAERLQHKSAIALSRLCSDPEVSQQVVELHGVGRLVRLCKEKRERNHSDAVLVACLAALRKITKNCGTTIMEENDVSQLVEPRLLDSFLTYSSKQESYV